MFRIIKCLFAVSVLAILFAMCAAIMGCAPNKVLIRPSTCLVLASADIAECEER